MHIMPRPTQIGDLTIDNRFDYIYDLINMLIAPTVGQTL